MKWNTILILLCSAFALSGTLCFIYQLYQIIVIDARARGLKHPGLWGLFSVSGGNNSGLILYLIGRRRYPIRSMSDQERNIISKRKRAIGAALLFLSFGTVGDIILLMMF